jgi:CRP-like cAMP-binding protein
MAAVSSGVEPAMSTPDPFLLQAMSANPWFAALDEATRLDLLSCGEPVSLRRGEFVFRQGDEGPHFYGLVSGLLRVSTLSETGAEAVLAVLEAGTWFGEASPLDGLPRTHDVAAWEDVTLLRVGHGDFDRLMQRNGFARAIALLQARYMRAVFAMLEDATLRSTRARIVRRLLRLARGDATLAATERHELRVTQDTLAMMIGVTRQTLALELKEMARHGAIRTGYGRIEIRSMERLREMASGAD